MHSNYNLHGFDFQSFTKVKKLYLRNYIRVYLMCFLVPKSLSWPVGQLNLHNYHESCHESIGCLARMRFQDTACIYET